MHSGGTCGNMLEANTTTMAYALQAGRLMLIPSHKYSTPAFGSRSGVDTKLFQALYTTHSEVFTEVVPHQKEKKVAPTPAAPTNAVLTI